MGCVNLRERQCRYCRKTVDRDQNKISCGVCSICYRQVDSCPETILPDELVLARIEKLRKVIGIKKTKNMTTVKNPQSSDMLVFKEVLEPTLHISKQIVQTPIQLIMYCNFQEKSAWFRAQIELLRIPWEKGCDKIEIDRQNVLFSGIKAMKKLNFRKELKVDFVGEKVDDAGGLLREWMHLSINQIFSTDNGVFKLCNTTETAYAISSDRGLVKEFVFPSLQVLGTIIGKALFERIPINCFLNRTLIRSICGQRLQMNDVYSFDKDLYRSWKHILECNNVEQLSLDWYITTPIIDGKQYKIHLDPKNKNKIVTEEDKQSYLTRIIFYCCYLGIREFVDTLKQAIYRIIPSRLLTIFQPHEFEMMLNGPSSIDVSDWRSNTLYEGGYNSQTHVIRDFWDILGELSNEELKNLLHYCTGATRVPLHGFSHLQSNRNQIKKFTIRKVEFDNRNPYPKAYTCFNRLQLPEYDSKTELYNQRIQHFGLG